MSDTTTIPLKKKTRDQLKKFGRKGETYDAVIKKLMTIAEQHEFYIEQKRILDEEEFLSIDEI
jgi:hypothetical protein